MKLRNRGSSIKRLDALDILKSEDDYKKYLHEFVEIKFICLHKGRGLFCKKQIEPSMFIGEYRGKTLTIDEGQASLKTSSQPSYIYFLKNKCIDGDKEDPISLANDSQKDANSIMKKLGDSEKIGLFSLSSKPIYPNEEIVYSYCDGRSNMPWRNKNQNLSNIYENIYPKTDVIKDPSKYCSYCSTAMSSMTPAIINKDSQIQVSSIMEPSTPLQSYSSPAVINNDSQIQVSSIMEYSTTSQCHSSPAAMNYDTEILDEPAQEYRFQEPMILSSDKFHDFNINFETHEPVNESVTQKELVLESFHFSEDSESESPEHCIMSQLKGQPNDDIENNEKKKVSKENAEEDWSPSEIHFHHILNEEGVFDEYKGKTYTLEISKTDNHIYLIEKIKEKEFQIIKGQPATMTSTTSPALPAAPIIKPEDMELNDVYKTCPIKDCGSKIKILSEHLKIHKLEKWQIKQYCREQRRRSKKCKAFRNPRKCPLDQCANALPYKRLDQHLRVVHKMNPRSSEYRSLIRNRSAPDPLATIKARKTKLDYSVSAQRYSMEFFDYMRSFSGGHESLDNAKIIAGQVRQILHCLNEIDMLDLSNKHVQTKLEDWFKEFNEEHKGSSGQTYSSNFLRFLKFYHTKYPTRLSTEGVATYDIVIKNWKKVFSKHKKMDESEKSEIEITAEEIATFESSPFYNEVVSKIEELTEDSVNHGRSLHRLIRDFLCLNLLLWNASRSGPVYNMTESEYRAGKVDTIDDVEMYTVGVRTHKTIMDYGACQMSFPMKIKRWIDIYRNCLRPTSDTIKVNNKTDKPMFIRWSGHKITHTDIYNGIKKIWLDAGMNSKIGSTVLRHFTVDESHEFMPEHDKVDLAYKMCHSISTAYNRYKSKLKTSKSAKSSLNIHQVVSGKLREMSNEVNINEPSTSQPYNAGESYFNSDKFIEQQTNSSLTRGLRAPGKGNRTFLESERKIISSCFNKWVSVGLVPSRSIIRHVISSENLESKIGEHATEKSVWGCLMNFKNKHPTNKMRKGNGKGKSSKK